MISHYIPNYPYFQEEAQTSYFDINAMLVEEAEKLYNLIAKDLLDEILNGYTVSTSTSLSLPLLSASNKDFPPN